MIGKSAGYASPTRTSAEYKQFTEYLKLKRKAKKLTLAAVSERVGLSITYTQKVESATRRLTIPELIAHCRAIKLDVHAALAELISIMESDAKAD